MELYRREKLKPKPIIEWVSSQPEKAGKYVVETKTQMGNVHRIESHFNGKSWNFTNQIFIKYLKES
jgi:hypothetical protein